MTLPTHLCGAAALPCVESTEPGTSLGQGCEGRGGGEAAALGHTETCLVALWQGLRACSPSSFGPWKQQEKTLPPAFFSLHHFVARLCVKAKEENVLAFSPGQDLPQADGIR